MNENATLGEKIIGTFGREQNDIDEIKSAAINLIDTIDRAVVFNNASVLSRKMKAIGLIEQAQMLAVKELFNPI